MNLNASIRRNGGDRRTSMGVGRAAQSVVRWGRSNLVIVVGLLLISGGLYLAYQFFSRPAGSSAAGTARNNQHSKSNDTDAVAARLPHLAALRQPTADTEQRSKNNAESAAADTNLTQLPTDAASLLEECTKVLETLSSNYPDLPDVYEIKARFFKWRGDSTEAEKLWQKCLELDPNYGHAYFGLAKVAVQRGKLEEAVALFEKALAAMPNFREVEIELARTLINLDRTADAIALFDKPEKRKTLQAEALCLLGQAYLQQKNYEQARTSYLAAVDTSPEYAEAYFGLATAMARLGQADKANEYTRKFHELNSKFMEKRTAERNSFEDLPAMCEDIASFYETVGRIYFLRGKTAEAERIWTRAAVLAPSNIPSRQSLAFLYRKTGQLENAVQTLEQLASIETNMSMYWLEVGRLRAQAGQFDAAEKVFQRLCTAFPNDPAGYASLVELYLETNRNIPDALELARKLVKVNQSARAYLLLAAASERNGDLPGAKMALEKGLEADPQNIACHRDLGRLHAALNDFPSAEKSFRAILSMAPENPIGYSELAQLFLRSGEKEKLSQSIQLARKTVELAPSSESYLLLSEAYRLNGLQRESADAQKKAAALAESGERPRPIARAEQSR